MNKTIVFVLLLVGLLSTTSTKAQLYFPLDSTFATNGRDTVDFFSETDWGYTAQVLPDQKIVVASTVRKAVGTNFEYGIGLVRYHGDGTLDNTFGNSGKIVNQFAPYTARSIADIAIQPDGKIVVCGYYNYMGNAIEQGFIARYLPDGNIDANFGTNGVTYVNFDNSTSSDTIRKIKILPNNQILGVGHATYTNGGGFGAVLLNSDGSFDANFGNNGTFFQDLGYMRNMCTSMAMDINNNIIIIGSVGTYWKYDYIMMKITPTGTLNTSFGNNGVVLIDIQNKNNQLLEAVTDENGEILLIGDVTGYMINPASMNYNSNDTIAFLKYTTDGLPNQGFGNNGMIIHHLNNQSLGGWYVENQAVLYPGGYVMYGGMTHPNFDYTNLKPFLMRINPDGSIATNIGDNGFSVTNIYPNYNIGEYIMSTIFHPDNKVLQIGAAVRQDTFGNYHENMLIARYLLNEVGTPSGIANGSTFLQPKLFPNLLVNEDKMTLEMSFQEKANLSLEIYDLQGNLIQKVMTKQTVEKGNQTFSLPISKSLADGKYQVVVSTENQMCTLPFVKL